MSSELIYRDFNDSYAEAVAEMWKQSRPGWPAGFFGPSEVTVESVMQDERVSGKLFTELAFAGERVVGYCRTSPYGIELDASYVDLLNVVPDMHGRGVGKALLRSAVKRSVQYGMNRIDLHTWPANMKAVPLYKKTGFFWIPESMVYMQNYIPYLLGREEFLNFLQGEDWYSCFKRALAVEPDTQKTPSEREIFRYEFVRGGDSFVAEFDRKGRCISKMEYPGFKAGLSVDKCSEFFTGRPYTVSLSGSGFNADTVVVTGDPSLKVEAVTPDSFAVTPLPVQMPKTEREVADRVSVSVNGVKLGIGMVGVEEVALHSAPAYFVLPGSSTLKLGLKKLAGVSSVSVKYAIDDGEFLTVPVQLSEDIYQSFAIDLPDLADGIHTVSVRTCESGYMETVVLVVGSYTGEPVAFDIRREAVIVGGSSALSIRRKGATCILRSRGVHGNTEVSGWFSLRAGPPNGDLSGQNYTIELNGNEITASAAWPSRPGMTYKLLLRLDPAGFTEAVGSVHNGTDTEQSVYFYARYGSGRNDRHNTILVPLSDGLIVEPEIGNQIPDWGEDLSSSASWLGAPWIGSAGKETASMVYFPGWEEIRYSGPVTAKAELAAGSTMQSPALRLLSVQSSPDRLMARAESLGWEVGNWRDRVPFLKHNLGPVMLSGSEVTLTHPLYGEREGAISAGKQTICSGRIKAGSVISGVLQGKGAVDVCLRVAGRDTLVPVYLVNKGGSVKLERNSEGILSLESGRVAALIDPSAFGHVFSLKLDSEEFLMASHPEPSTFAWEKPWYGGIHPSLRGKTASPYPMDKQNPEVEEYCVERHGVVERGWQMSWKVNHKKYGSVLLRWRAGLVSGVPVLRTSLECTSTGGKSTDGSVDIRGFLQPGGSVEGAVLTCDSMPGLVQGRSHSGAWTDMGRWGRMQRDEFFVEACAEGGVFSGEDFGEAGCVFSVSESTNRNRKLTVTWVFGNSSEDAAVAEMFRAHNMP